MGVPSGSGSGWRQSILCCCFGSVGIVHASFCGMLLVPSLACFSGAPTSFVMRSVLAAKFPSLTSDQVLHISSGSSVQLLDLTTWSDLAHNLEDLLLLDWREAVLPHVQCLELSLPGEDDK